MTSVSCSVDCRGTSPPSPSSPCVRPPVNFFMKRRRRQQLVAAKKAPAAAAATDGDVPVAAPASSVDRRRSRSENHGKKPDDIPLLTQHSSRSVFFWARRYSERKTLSCRCLLRITSDRGSVGRDRFIRPSIPPGCETRQESLRKCLRSQRRVRLFIRLRPIPVLTILAYRL